MSELQFTTVDTIMAKLYRDLKGLDLHETDVIEWIGEALEFLKVSQIQEQAVTFLEVKDYEVDVPCHFQMVLQLAKHNHAVPMEEMVQDLLCSTTEEEEETTECAECNDGVRLGCNGELPGDYEYGYYRPTFDLYWEYQLWQKHPYYLRKFSPIRLSNNTFFNSIVSKEKDYKDIYHNCVDEYTIVGSEDKKFRFSFKEGIVALSYLKSRVDKETGYPLVPDQISHITAIVYYIKWKMAERMQWSGREGFAGLAKDSRDLWLKYVRQAKNYVKMPKGIDQHQNLLEATHHLIPRHARYYNYFGNLGRFEVRNFNNPDNNIYGR